MSVFLSKIKVLALYCYLSLNVKTTSHKQDMEGSRHGSLIIITVINQYLAGIAFKEMQRQKFRRRVSQKEVQHQCPWLVKRRSSYS